MTYPAPDVASLGDLMTLSDSSLAPTYPLITIAIPTFNRATLLKGCVASALSQTYPHLEVVVSNNASTDGTLSVLSEFDDARLRVITQATNIGMHPNWNACLANAKGDYIVFVSDDDRIAPTFLEQCTRLIRQQPQLPIVIALSNIHAAALQRTKPAHTSRFHDTGVWNGTEILTDFLTDQTTVAVCSVMMRTDLLRARGGYPLDLPHTADVACWAPLLLLGKAGFVNEACATFTYHSQSATARLGVELLLRDGRAVADLIAQTAETHVADPQQRRTIQIEARRHFARRGLTALSDYRSSGGGIQELFNVLWQFRHDLSNVSVKAVLRFLAVVLCPQPLATQLRQLRYSIQERLA
ncbi:glycosyltransferase family 2 protein [Bradyrhizobium sp. LHD-71]|uniref:glycosyltransferase family 2 protein n=1 Tax=Bradyrhizobium sp. LHD-71 TaxID=3072141 RepID=UPI00280C68A5|nr:glycosyltransferase family 2 protein [Bradyrhizobium sp. LHD-71]MDQ8728051.1 glycosyltransferase family 2 protein [Bradyrhizobium sp. LHD-71]